LDIKSDFYDNNKQINVRTNEALNNSVIDIELETILDTVLQAESSTTYPQIIENTECQINMTVLQKSVDSTANDSFNTSILQKFSEHSNINISDINITDTISNSTIMNDKIPAKNTSISTSFYGDTELDMTLTDFSDLNEVKSSIVNNNTELYCNNHQVAHVLQNTDIYTFIYYILIHFFF